MAAAVEKAFEHLGITFGISEFKPLQRLCLEILVSGQDVFACLPTGYGKSLIYQTWAGFAEQLAREGFRGAVKENGLVLVISPLIAIMEEQTTTLMSKGVLAAYIGKDEATDRRIAEGEYNIVFSSPESLLSNSKWIRTLQTPLFRERLVGIAVDEVHTVVDWGLQQGTGEPFRKWYGKVGELRSVLPATVPMLAVTATASTSTREAIKKELGMQDCFEVVTSPDRPNIRLSVKKVTNVPTDTFSWLCRELASKGVETDKVVIYCKSIDDCGLVYDVFDMYLGLPAKSDDDYEDSLVIILHSESSDLIKKHVIKSLSDPSSKLRVVIATSVLGLGVDFKGVNCVINYGPPRNMEEYMQCYGRAGREGSEAHSIILYHGIQTVGLDDNMKEYMNNVSSCRRVLLMALFDGEVVEPLTPKHACCNICASTCDCQEQCDGGSSSLEKHAGEATVQQQRQVSDEQRASLRTALLEKSDYLTQEGLYNTAVYCTEDQLVGQPSALIEEIIESCDQLFTLEDIFCNIQISDTVQAKLVLEIVKDVFGDDA